MKSLHSPTLSPLPGAVPAHRLAWWLALLLPCLRPALAGVEDHADYRFEYYAEEKGRTLVRTHAAAFEAGLTDAVTLKGEFVHDAISGATPIGGPPPEGSTQVPLVELRDTRNAGNLEFGWSRGDQVIKPLFAYSLENDYESISPALNWEINFNRKNTTLLLGVAGNWDSIFAPTLNRRTEHKRTADFIAGISQVLSPNTVLSLNLTLGTASGYLSDPYKRVRFDLAPEGVLELEKRPGHRTRQVVDVTLRQFVEPLHGNAEIGYRLYHDSFGIVSHTAALTWFQQVGRRVVISPLFRYYQQSSADFFSAQFAGDPSNPDLAAEFPVPGAYSSDYRLSHLHTLSYGVGLRWNIHRRFAIDASYKRYEMIGDDSSVASSNFPVANIVSVGLRLGF